jgi:hypothetical protein
MNGGIIKDAASLPERFWSRHGITANILPKSSPLWTWIDSDLSVEPYDIDGESLYLKKSNGGKIGNEKRWKSIDKRTDNRSPNRSPNPPDQTRPDQTSPDQTSSSDEEGGGGLFAKDGNSVSKKISHELFDYWNTFKELAKIRDVTTKRKTQLKARMKEDFFRENWKAAITKISQTPFLTGTSDRGWRADIDWFLTSGNLTKIIEGKYDSQKSKPIATVNIGGRNTINSEEV